MCESAFKLTQMSLVMQLLVYLLVDTVLFQEKWPRPVIQNVHVYFYTIWQMVVQQILSNFELCLILQQSHMATNRQRGGRV